MWANTGGFTSGGYTTTATDNPYINYNIFYQQTRDYSSKNTTGDAKSLTYTAGNDDYYLGGNKTITGDYKWLMVRNVKSTAGDFGRIVITGTGGTLTLGDDFLLYVQEIDSYFDPAFNTVPAGYAVGRSGWKAVQGTWDQGATVQLNIYSYHSSISRALSYRTIYGRRGHLKLIVSCKIFYTTSMLSVA